MGPPSLASQRIPGVSNLASDTLFIRNFSEGAGNVELPLMDVVGLSVRVVWAQSCSLMDSSVQHSLWVIVDPPPLTNDKKYKCRLGFQPHFGRFINHPHGLQYTVKICGQILRIALQVCTCIYPVYDSQLFVSQE